MKFVGFMSKGWGLLTPCFVPRGVFVHSDCPEGKGFCSFQVVSREFVPGGMALDEIDTCIKRHRDTGYPLSFPSQFIHRQTGPLTTDEPSSKNIDYLSLII